MNRKLLFPDSSFVMMKSWEVRQGSNGPHGSYLFELSIEQMYGVIVEYRTCLDKGSIGVTLKYTSGVPEVESRDAIVVDDRRVWRGSGRGDEQQAVRYLGSLGQYLHPLSDGTQ